MLSTHSLLGGMLELLHGDKLCRVCNEERFWWFCTFLFMDAVLCGFRPVGTFTVCISS